MFVYLGRRLHDFLGRARFIQLYIAGAIGGEIVSTLYPKYRPEWVEQVVGRNKIVIPLMNKLIRVFPFPFAYSNS